jgi:hypothetical protein
MDMLKANLVVNSLIEVFDENVALACLAQGGVTLRPHDPAANEDETQRRTRPKHY